MIERLPRLEEQVRPDDWIVDPGDTVPGNLPMCREVVRQAIGYCDDRIGLQVGAPQQRKQVMIGPGIEAGVMARRVDVLAQDDPAVEAR
jgi:hypothetical protein